MKEFAPYVAQLKELALSVAGKFISEEYRIKINTVLDGQPSEFLRRNISLTDMRDSGAFFTGHKLANQLVEPLKGKIEKGVKIIDPACGAGDLLLACAKKLPVFNSFEKTLGYWGSILYGYDIHNEFVKSTKLRLTLLAMSRYKMSTNDLPDINTIFPNILVKDFLSPDSILPKVGIIILNPPFTRTTKYKCDWADGLVSTAGLFVDKCVKSCHVGTKIIAILPDVLRSGSHYKKWRDFISERTEIEKIEVIGKFDSLTDVDVFGIRMCYPVRKVRQIDWNLLGEKDTVSNIFGNIFNIRVGPVVPFRDIESGLAKPYIDARTIKPWETITAGRKKRRYNKKLYMPPFIVVKRTSGPSDKARAVASIVIGSQKIAVENHLVILQPLTRSLVQCKRALKILKSDATTSWLNNRIRCRHLTTSAIAEIPWLEIKK